MGEVASLSQFDMSLAQLLPTFLIIYRHFAYLHTTEFLCLFEDMFQTILISTYDVVSETPTKKHQYYALVRFYYSLNQSE